MQATLVVSTEVRQKMRTLKVMAIIGLVLYGGHIIFSNIQGLEPDPRSNWVGPIYGVALSVIALVKSKAGKNE